MKWIHNFLIYHVIVKGFVHTVEGELRFCLFIHFFNTKKVFLVL